MRVIGSLLKSNNRTIIIFTATVASCYMKVSSRVFRNNFTRENYFVCAFALYGHLAPLSVFWI